MKIGRNELCPCGSGKKYKKCCMDKPKPPIKSEAIKAAELIRTQQQGLGRPIISSEIKGQPSLPAQDCPGVFVQLKIHEFLRLKIALLFD
jgi:hypothetical protein